MSLLRPKRSVRTTASPKGPAPSTSPIKKPGFECQICFHVSVSQLEYVNHIVSAHTTPQEPPKPEKNDADHDYLAVEEDEGEVDEGVEEEDVQEAVEEDDNADHQPEEVKHEPAQEVHLFTEEDEDDYVAEVHETEEVEVLAEPTNDFPEFNDSAKRKHPNTCPCCKKVYSTRTHFKMHWDSKCGQDKKFECEYCGAKFISHASRKVHMLKHVGGQEFRCEHCEKAFLSAGQLKVHLRLHTKEKPFQCSACGKAFAHRESLVTHSSIHTGIMPYACLNCEKKFSCIGNLIKHRKTRVDTCGLPQFCSNVKVAPRPNTKFPGTLLLTPIQNNRREAKNETSVVKHLLQSSRTRCSRKAKRMKQEEQEEEEADEKKSQTMLGRGYVVVEVNEEEEEHDELAVIAMESEEEEEEEEDPQLAGDKEEEVDAPSILTIANAGGDTDLEVFTKEGGRLVARTYVIEHQVAGAEEVELDLDEEMEDAENVLPTEASAAVTYVCDICMMSFEDEEKAIEHQNSHADEEERDIEVLEEAMEDPRPVSSSGRRPRTKHRGVVLPAGNRGSGIDIRFDCSKCHRSFAVEKSLQKHVDTDCGRISEHMCIVCNKGYASAATLRTHMTCHTSEMAYECQTCKKKLRTLVQLNVHTRVHTGERPFKCDKCEKAFAHRETLITHQSVHTGYKRFLCTVCGNRFSCLSNLMSHRRARKETCGMHPPYTRPVGENEDETLLMIGAEEFVG